MYCIFSIDMYWQLVMQSMMIYDASYYALMYHFLLLLHQLTPGRSPVKLPSQRQRKAARWDKMRQDETRWLHSIVDSRVHPGVQPLFRSWLLNILDIVFWCFLQCRALAARTCLFSGNWRCTPTCKEPLNKPVAAFFYCIIQSFAL